MKALAISSVSRPQRVLQSEGDLRFVTQCRMAAGEDETQAFVGDLSLSKPGSSAA